MDESPRMLRRADLPADPLVLLRAWLDAAREAGLVEPDAMALATVDADGRPANRMVLCRGLDARGLAFFTNLQSRKGRALAARPWAAATFWWPRLERQVRVEGEVTPVDPAESDAYFASRPRDRQIAAWASPQSEVVAHRDDLDARIAAIAARFADTPQIPRPPFWGGLRIAPERLEFWQGHVARAHDRFCYERGGAGYRIARLAP